MAEKMEEYNNALGQMSNEAVEYVRGISVVKTFGQSVFSFRRFKEAIDNYEKWMIAYTKDLRFPMMCYTTLVNGIFAVLIAAALVMTSGGEQQRISIARVMLKNAPVLILDEATAFADPDNEAKVQAAFNVLAKGKTVLMIAHRLSTVTGADRIVVIKDGKIEDTGTHGQLKDKDGLYAEMWRQYNKAAKWKVGVSNA